jgi:hypothetical protein
VSNDEVMRITEKLSNFLSNEIAAMTRDERIFTPRDIENAVYQGILAAYEVGEIAMREKAARMLDEEVRLSAYAAEVQASIRALAISGAEESKKEKA